MKSRTRPKNEEVGLAPLQEEKWDGTEAVPRAPESAHQQRGESPRRTEHWLSVAEGNCVVERRGGGQLEANNQCPERYVPEYLTTQEELLNTFYKQSFAD
jgi:hypothetical protein